MISPAPERKDAAENRQDDDRGQNFVVRPRFVRQHPLDDPIEQTVLVVDVGHESRHDRHDEDVDADFSPVKAGGLGHGTLRLSLRPLARRNVADERFVVRLPARFVPGDPAVQLHPDRRAILPLPLDLDIPLAPGEPRDHARPIGRVEVDLARHVQADELLRGPVAEHRGGGRIRRRQNSLRRGLADSNRRKVDELANAALRGLEVKVLFLELSDENIAVLPDRRGILERLAPRSRTGLARHGLQHAEDFRRCRGFSQKTVRADSHRHLLVRGRCVRRRVHDDRDPPKVLALAHFTAQPVAVHPRHENVGHDDIERALPERLESLASVAGLRRLVPGRGQDRPQQLAVQREVVDDQDSHFRLARNSAICAGSRRVSIGLAK